MVVQNSEIQFRIMEPSVWQDFRDESDQEHRLYRYNCASCYASCGDLEKVFSTGYDYQKNMRLGPTRQQMHEMKQHAEQHSIIWNWARQQDR